MPAPLRALIAVALLVGCDGGLAPDAGARDGGLAPDAGARDGGAVRDGGDDPCAGRADGERCEGDALVTCADGATIATLRCADGCAEPARCAEPAPPSFCATRTDGPWCDGDRLVGCEDGEERRMVVCDHGCAARPLGEADRCARAPTPDFCGGRLNGLWCDGDDLVRCAEGEIATRTRCAAGCASRPLGTPDECAAPPLEHCTPVPAVASSAPPSEMCNSMDWGLEPDGWYLISRFGTTNDPTTLGRRTTCGWLRSHYDYRGCVYDRHAGACLPGPHEIPWVEGHVDYDYAAVIAAVDAAGPGGDVEPPEYFYVAGAQRFHCGTTLRVSNPATGRCYVAYAEDGGPGARYEYADRGGRRMVDASPALVRALSVTRWGWRSADLVYVEWGRPGDVPGRACTPCESTPARAGTLEHATGFDPNHMQPIDCR